MQLKSLQIQGFKSFPDKTELIFGQGMTAVVGPNGSGKSNISDAVRWVLGEQSTRNLRGDKMEDVIFLGTHDRKPTGFASVSLTIDNSDRSLPVEADDVTISRKLYRSGESEYRLNKTAVRLKDITELLMDTGLGRDGYSIIGQGRIEEIVSAKGTRRREIFEEAAGISKYRFRKEEAQKKLESAYDNLLRLKDIIGELEVRVEPLRKQAEKAKEFLNLSQKKKELEISLWAHSIRKLKEELAQKEKEYLILKNNCIDSQSVLEEYQKKIAETSDKAQEYLVKIEEHRKMSECLKQEQSECTSSIAVAKNDLQHNEQSIAQLHQQIFSFADNKDETKTQLKENQKELAEKQKQLAFQKEQETQVEQELAAIDQEISTFHDTITGLKARRMAFEQDIAKERLNRVSSKALLEETTRRLQELEEEKNSREAAITSLEQELCQAESLMKEILEREENLNNMKAGFSIKLANQKKAADQITEECHTLESSLEGNQHKIHILQEMEKSMEGYYPSVRKVLGESTHGRLKDIRGTVSQLFSVPGEYACAIETALGNALQNIIAKDENAAKAAILYLKQGKHGRATFLPMNVMKPQPLPAKDIEKMEGFVGRASDLVECESQYRNIAESLLGKIAVAEDIDAAIRIARKYGYHFKIVTLDGQLVNSGGAMTGGSASKGAGLLSRKDEIDTLTKEAEKKQKQLDELLDREQESKIQKSKIEAEILRLDGQLKTCGEDKITCHAEQKRLRLSYEEALRARERMKQEEAYVNHKLEELDSSSTNAETLISQVEQELDSLQEDIDRTKEDHEKLSQAKQVLYEQQGILRLNLLSSQKDIESLESSCHQLEDILQKQDDHVQNLLDQINALQNEGRNLNKKIQNLAAHQEELVVQTAQEDKEAVLSAQQRTRSEKELTNLRAHEKEYITRRERAAAQLSRCQEKKELLQEEYDKIIAKLWDEYEMTRSDALAQSQEIKDEISSQAKLNELRGKIRALGNVNVSAIEEYREVSQRWDFLKKQSQDVETSRNELISMIRELTGEMRKLFLESFEQINKNFKEIFAELFMGGKGELILSEPERVLESGIEIKVQPPGKIIKNLAALSGGEKALVAIAIYFAIMKVRPSPFCVLDEIEAALDEINVSRYAQYLKRLSDKTQFINITHRRGTMEEADILYGVTMQEKGVSRLLALDISQVESKLGIKS